jgi:hypothetical protein
MIRTTISAVRSTRAIGTVEELSNIVVGLYEFLGKPSAFSLDKRPVTVSKRQ